MGNSCAHPFPPPSTESVQSSSSAAGGPPTSEWVLMSVISTRWLGTRERLKKLEEIRQRKNDHGEAIVTSLTLALWNCYLSPSLSPIPLLLHSPLLSWREILAVTKSFGIKPYYPNTSIHITFWLSGMQLHVPDHQSNKTCRGWDSFRHPKLL